MYYDSFLPFLRRSPLLKRYIVDVPVEHILFPSFSPGVEAADEPALEFMKTRAPRAYLVKPLNILVLDDPRAMVNWYKQNMKTLKCIVHEVDYHKVARYIEFPSDTRAEYPGTNMNYTADVTDTKLATQAANLVKLIDVRREGETLSFGPSTNLFESATKDIRESQIMMRLNEISDDMIDFYNETDIYVDGSEVMSPIEARLESYLLSGYVTQRVPLLLGPTAVAKSSLVKSLCRKHDFRLVDLRASFMTRLDFEGLTQSVEMEGDLFSYNAPMEEIVECTDDYVNFCRASVPKIEARLEMLRQETGDGIPEKIAGLEKLKAYYVDRARAPVLFFDEVTRSDEAVRNALMKILNEKSFMDMDMKLARIVAATNFPVGLPESLHHIYITAEIDDVAFADRFEAMTVVADDLMDDWGRWARGESKKAFATSNINPHLLEFLEQNPDETYNFNDVIARHAATGNDYEVMVAAFPNYRTWEMASDYVYKVENDTKVIQTNVLKGLLGDRVGAMLADFLETKGFTHSTPEEKDELSSVVWEAMLHNVPTMLVGPSSLGKTTRIKNAARKMGAEFIEVNLSMADRTDIMGPPVKVDLTKNIGKSVADIDLDLAEELSESVRSFNLPEKITTKAPKAGIAARFDRAVREQRPVVLFFDELNRVSNESLMSAVFEAISDHRIFGINFDPNLVRIFSACNLGENTVQAQDLDPAFAARFNIHYRQGYQLSDAESFLEYIERTDFSPILVEYLKSLPLEELLEMISSVEARTIESSVPSSRAFTDLDLYIKDTENAHLIEGTILFSSNETVSSYIDMRSTTARDDEKFKSFVETIEQKLANWSGLTAGFTVTNNSRVLQAPEVAQHFKEMKGRAILPDGSVDWQQAQVMLKIAGFLYNIDDKVKMMRRKAFSFVIGDAAEGFTGYYNTVSGTGQVDVSIEDLVDKSLMARFFELRLAGTANPTDMINIIVGHSNEFINHFGDSLSKEHYQEFLIRAVDSLPSQDGKYVLITKIAQDDTTDLILQHSESDQFILDLMRRIGSPVSQEDVNDLTADAEVDLPKPSVLGG